MIARRGGGINETFTVRKISAGVGVERVFPLHSPMYASIDVVRRGRVRRAKLYYLREAQRQEVADHGRPGEVTASKREVRGREDSRARFLCPPYLLTSHLFAVTMLCMPPSRHERLAWSSGHLLIGIDEVGRGPLAGPVVAAAVCFPIESSRHTRRPRLEAGARSR